jgi:hypothetical protein
MEETIELSAHRVDYGWRAMAGIQTADSAGKINQPVAIYIFDHRSFSFRNKHWRGVIRRLHNRRIAPLHERS